MSMVNKRNSHGQTPLYVCCKNGNFDMLRFLIDNKADVYIKSIVGAEEETILAVASRWSHLKIVRFLLDEYKWKQGDLKYS
jgi:ankyrin repeat protein